METLRFRAECKWCNKSLLSSHIGKCPHCGKIGKNVYAKFNEVISLKDILNSELRREFFKENNIIKWILIFVSFGSPFLGLKISGWYGVLIGLILSLISYFLGPYSVIRIREIIKNRTF